MSLGSAGRRALNAILGAFDLRLGRKSALDRNDQLASVAAPLLERLGLDSESLHSPDGGAPRLPQGAVEHLRHDNPRLVELRERYRRFEAPVTRASWWNPEFVAREVDLHGFRGDVAYVWQHRDFNAAVHYVATTQYVQRDDRHGLLQRLGEDDLFGARTYQIEESLIVSRDLLDSILELSFLDRHLNLFGRDRVRMLDIGAGYGRFAHRAAAALGTRAEILCTDAIAESSFLCEYYLKFREVDRAATAVPLDEVRARLQRDAVDVAVNIHSFSECPLAAITWWLDLVAERAIPHLMVIPNALANGGQQLLSREPGGSNVNFQPEIERRGYRLSVREPKYRDPLMQRHGVTPTHYWLFERG